MALVMQAKPNWKLISAEKLAPLSFLLSLVVIDITWAVWVHIRFIGFELILSVVIALFLVSIVYGRLRINRRLSEISYYAALWIIFTAVSAPLTYMAAMWNLPLYDTAFVMADKIFGFDWLRYYQFFEQHKIFSNILLASYFSFLPQVAFSILFFSHTGLYERNNELFWSASIAIVITALASGIFPAAGTLYHFKTGLEYAVHLHDFFALREGAVLQFAFNKMEGIVTFPSYHTVGALLLIYVYRRTSIFLPILLLNVLMLLSTPIFGGHYLVDMLGGAVVALFSILAANRARRLLIEARVLFKDSLDF